MNETILDKIIQDGMICDSIILDKKILRQFYMRNFKPDNSVRDSSWKDNSKRNNSISRFYKNFINFSIIIKTIQDIYIETYMFKNFKTIKYISRLFGLFKTFINIWTYLT